MYGFNQDIEVAFLGAILESISFTENSVAFEFSGKKSINAFDGLTETRVGAIEKEEPVHIPVASTDLPRLVGRTVRASFRPTNESLILEFDSGDRLAFRDQPGYETFHLVLDGDEFYV